MERKFYKFFRKSIAARLLLFVSLLVGGGDSVWGNRIDNGDGTFTENFTGIAKTYSPASFTFPSGWNFKGTATKFSVSTYAGNYVESPSIYMMSANTTTYLITPALEGDFSFWMRSSSSASESYVKAYKCTYENGDWVIGDLISEVTIEKASPIAEGTVKSVSFSGHSQVALLLSYAYLDDFTYTPYVAVGDIATPTSLTAANPQPTSIDLSWTAGGSETTWQFSYGTTSGSLDHKSGYVTTNPYTLTGLTPNTTYYISVRALNDVFSDWSAETSFTTAGDIAVTGVTVSPTSWEMLAGTIKNLTVTVSPANATYQDVSWESDNTSVATVTSAGEVTAVEPGTATITVKSVTDNTIAATCEITVTAPVTPTAFKTQDLYSDYANLTWTNGSSEYTWQIKYGTTSGDLTIESGDISSSKKPYLITGLSSGTTYYASIRSKLGTAYSAWSDVLSFTTPIVGPSCGGATETVESFDSGWGTTSPLTIKSGWNYFSNKTNFSLNESYRYGASGYGLIGGYSTSQYILTPELQVGSNFKFRVCRATTNTSTGTVKLYKAIKVGNTYYIDENTIYSNISLPNGTEITMNDIQSCTITEGGYVAIQLYCAAIDDITYQASSTVSAITDNNGYTTFASPNMLDLTTVNLPSGLEAYKAKVNGATVKFSEINQTVPANTGILLKGNPHTEYKIAIAESSSDVEDNDFEVNSTKYTFAATDGYTYFGMIKNSNPLTFGEFDPSTVAIPTNKAYLKVLTSSLPAESRQLTFLFDENETTAINDLPTAAAKKADDAVFSITGQRVSTPTKGLYIINGKKHIIK